MTITDAHHPLAGQRFPVVSLCAPQGPHQLVIALPDGRQRAVRRSATDLDPATSVPLSDVLGGPRLGIRPLLSLARYVRDMLARQEIPDASAHASAPSTLDSPAATSTLASDVRCPATAAGTALGAVTATDAAPDRKGEAAC